MLWVAAGRTRQRAHAAGSRTGDGGPVDPVGEGSALVAYFKGTADAAAEAENVAAGAIWADPPLAAAPRRPRGAGYLAR